MDKIEEIARAICEHGAVSSLRWDDRSEHQKNCFRKDARAAYEVMTRSDGEVRMREALADIEAAALRYNGPLARDRDADTLRAIGKLAALTQSSVQPD